MIDIGKICGLIFLVGVTSTGVGAQDYSGIRTANQNAVVFIYSERVKKDGTGVREDSSGTGFVVTEYGHVISANHVVLEETRDTIVKTWGSIGSRNSAAKYPVEVVKREGDLDLVLLALQIPADLKLQIAQMGNSGGLRLDAALYALGFPGKSDLSPATGILSNRSGPKGRWQTTLGINRGNSGGPVFDPQTKKVVAIAWAGDDTAQQVTYAIPESYASGLLQIAGSEAIAATVKAAIRSDATLKHSNVVVAAANDSIMLRGFVGSNDAKLTVAKLASQIKGVKFVTNDIVIVDFNYSSPIDFAITQQVKRKLEEDMVASKIAVETTNGVVILSGFPKSEAISQGAIATVRSIEGVKTVKNAMAVVKF